MEETLAQGRKAMAGMGDRVILCWSCWHRTLRQQDESPFLDESHCLSSPFITEG